MHDPDFHTPSEKAASEYGPAAPPPLPTCRLAVLSLVFGILGWAPLPLIGAVVAVVTGHFALAEIRESGGRLGGRSAAKAGLVLGSAGILAFVLVIYFAGVSVRAAPRVLTEVRTTFAAPPGVKMANEMSSAEIASLKQLGLRDEPDDEEEIIAYYHAALPSDGEPETAVLTNRRIAYLKGDRLTSFDLKDVDAVLPGEKYQQKYAPGVFGSTSRYPIEIKRKTGGRMRIVIEPAIDGHVFSQALEDAWKAAGGKPEEAEHK